MASQGTGFEWDYASSSSDRHYTVLYNTMTGRISCGCRGWVIQRKKQVNGKEVTVPRGCPHTEDRIEKLVKQGYTIKSVEAGGTFLDVGGQAKAVGKSQGATTNGKSKAEVTSKVSADKENAGNGFVWPQLAHPMPEGTSVDSYDPKLWGQQQKYDGMRLIVSHTKGKTPMAWSRLGNKRKLPEHLAALVSRMPSGTYDGELLIRGGRSSDVVATVNNGNECLALFDVLSLSINGKKHNTMDRKYSERDKLLRQAVAAIGKNKYVFVPPLTKPSAAAVRKLWKQGAEGVLLKQLDGRYKPNHRSHGWLKVKAMAEEDMKIVGYERTEAGGDNAVVIVEARPKPPKRPKAKRTTVKVRSDWFKAFAKSPAAAIGTWVEIRYHQETSDSFRHPRMGRAAGPHE